MLRELQQDARLPNIALAKRIRLSPAPCSRRVRQLESEGVIAGYRAVLNRNAVGLHLTAFAGMRVARSSQEETNAFVDAILAIPEVIACHLISGEFDFLAEVVAPDIATYESTILRQLLALPGVRDIRSSFAMKTVKADGCLPITDDGLGRM
jgi:Lrp/AsnC family leucine-responsive transcriptional regulator